MSLVKHLNSLWKLRRFDSSSKHSDFFQECRSKSVSPLNEHNPREVIRTHGFYSHYLQVTIELESVPVILLLHLEFKCQTFFILWSSHFIFRSQKKKKRKAKIAFFSLGYRLYPNCLTFVSNASVLFSSSVQSYI